jgi:hypothetical protein
MSTFRTVQTVPESSEIVLNELPFAPGERVEVVVRSCPVGSPSLAEEWNRLLKSTQSLPQVQRLTDDDIAAEVAALRSGQ